MNHVVRPDSAYLRLRCDPKPLDNVTWNLIVVSALSRFGGIHASAIPVEFVAYIPDFPEHSEAIIRCPNDDADIVSGAVGGAQYEEYSLKVLKCSSYLPFLV